MTQKTVARFNGVLNDICGAVCALEGEIFAIVRLLSRWRFMRALGSSCITALASTTNVFLVHLLHLSCEKFARLRKSYSTVSNAV